MLFRKVGAWVACGLLLHAVIHSSLGGGQRAHAEETPKPLPVVEPQDRGLAASSLQEIDEVVDDAIGDGEMAGAVVLIGYREAVVFHRAYGHRQLQPEPLPMQTDTLFDLASLTKPIATATSVMKLVEQDIIALDDPVAQHLPAFATNGKNSVTIRQLLLHTGGLIPDNSLKDYQEGSEAAIENFLGLSLSYEPGTKFRYSDVGFLVLAELVREKTGKDVAAYSREAIFQPLGMSETDYLPQGELKQRAAATERREDRWMVGEVHDPRAYALDGIAGHAGLFSTATDLAIYAQAMLSGGSYQGAEILRPETVQEMTAAYDVPGGKRALGWDKRSGYSSNRGRSMSDAAFGHGGFTGTAMWIDPELELFVIFLSNRLHPDGKGSVNRLAGRIGTIAADAVRDARDGSAMESAAPGGVLCGVDVLSTQQMRPLAGRRVGLITNHTGVTRDGEPTALRLQRAAEVELVALFSPEHGFAGKLDQSEIGDIVDPVTGVKVFSLYGANRAPTAESLEGIDTLVFDIQDIGTRFYTYISTMGEAMRVAAEHDIRFVVLDRPNPINGIDVAGPLLDEGEQSFVGYHTIPVRHGMTAGELAQLFKNERDWEMDLEVVPCRDWQREDYYDATGLYWINPSPNMRTLNQAILYPGIGLLEYTNLSVGRGTDTPFEIIGAPWMNGRELTNHLQRLNLPGVAFIPTHFTPASSKFEGELCEGMQILITDRKRIEPLKVGFAIALTLRELYRDHWEMKAYDRLLSSDAVFDAIAQGDSLEKVMEIAERDRASFLERRKAALIYESKPSSDH